MTTAAGYVATRRGGRLTQAEIDCIRTLRADGWSITATAQAVGRCYETVRNISPGRAGKAPVAPLREAFERSGRSHIDVARDIGWWTQTHPDGARVRRFLGLLADIDNGGRRYRTVGDIETIGRIAEAIGVSPWAVLPEEEA